MLLFYVAGGHTVLSCGRSSQLVSESSRFTCHFCYYETCMRFINGSCHSDITVFVQASSKVKTIGPLFFKSQTISSQEKNISIVSVQL